MGHLSHETLSTQRISTTGFLEELISGIPQELELDAKTLWTDLTVCVIFNLIGLEEFPLIHWELAWKRLSSNNCDIYVHVFTSYFITPIFIYLSFIQSFTPHCHENHEFYIPHYQLCQFLFSLLNFLLYNHII